MFNIAKGPDIVHCRLHFKSTSKVGDRRRRNTIPLRLTFEM
jgi:hypothetical protein